MSSKKIESAFLTMFIIAIAIFVIGTAAIPVVIAIQHGWTWLLLYPLAFILICLWANKRKK